MNTYEKQGEGGIRRAKQNFHLTKPIRSGSTPTRSGGLLSFIGHESQVASHGSSSRVPLHRRGHGVRMALGAVLTPHWETSPPVPVSKSSRADAGCGSFILPIPGQVSCRQAGPGSIQ
jgi:hypothetical protein